MKTLKNVGIFLIWFIMIQFSGLMTSIGLQCYNNPRSHTDTELGIFCLVFSSFFVSMIVITMMIGWKAVKKDETEAYNAQWEKSV